MTDRPNPFTHPAAWHASFQDEVSPPVDLAQLAEVIPMARTLPTALSLDWDAYTLRQAVVHTHLVASHLARDLAENYPAALIPEDLARAAQEARDALGRAVALLDACQSSADAYAYATGQTGELVDPR